MRKLFVLLALSLATSMTFAADSGCEAKAIDKNGKPLTGAAKNAFIKKCEGGSTAAPSAAGGTEADCEKKALSKDGKPLYGAAKNAFVKKCVKDAGK